MTIITIGGAPGTGTSTVGKLLAKTLPYDFLSGGDIMRDLARKNNKSVEQFVLDLKSNSRLDRALDIKQRDILPESDIVLDSRMGWMFAPNPFKVLLESRQDVRITRLMERDKVTKIKALENDALRQKSDSDRYYYLYGVTNYLSTSHYDLIIDSSDTSPHDIVIFIIEQMVSLGHLKNDILV